MPRKAKKQTTKMRSRIKHDVLVESLPAEPFTHAPFEATKRKENMKSFWLGTVVVLLVIFGILAFRNGWIISATVDGQPIFSWQLTSELNRRYGKQTLEGMITEKMIEVEAGRQGITITKPDIDARQKDMLAEFGPEVDVDEILQLQGLTRTDFDRQVSIQLAVEKMLTKDLKITDEDVSNYIATNEGRFTATEEATLKADVGKAITNEYIAEVFQSWFTGLKEKTKIDRFIK